MENQPATGRQWFRLASQARMEPPAPAPAPTTAPAGPAPRRGPPIRQASIALARSNLAPDTPEPPQTQPTTLPPPAPQVVAPPPVEAAAPPPPPPPTTALLRQPTPPSDMAPAPPKAPTPPPASVQTTMMTPRTTTQPTNITLPRTITPPTVPAPRTQTPPPAAEPPVGKFIEELAPAPVAEPPKSATLPPLTAAAIVQPAQPPLARPPSNRNSNGSSSNMEKPLMTTSEAIPVILRPVATRARTPPESPKVIKASSPTPPQSPRIKQQQSVTNLKPSSEPEPRAPQPKSIDLQENPEKDYGAQGALQKSIKQQAEARNAPPPSPKKEEKPATTANGKAFTMRKDEDMRIITIAGENYGAIMDLGSDHQLHGRNHQIHHPKSHAVESGRDDGKSSNMPNTMSKTKTMISLTNSNVQCVNNSILFNASSVNRSPGVHINFTRRHQTNTTSSTTQDGHPPLH